MIKKGVSALPPPACTSPQGTEEVSCRGKLIVEKEEIDQH